MNSRANLKSALHSTPTRSQRGKIPTTFVPLSPEKLLYGDEADLLFGLFHIMWADMPRRTTYRVRLADLVTREGEYAGCKLACMNQGMRWIDC
ncbi:MAG: hypothetical protein M1587_06595 [Thaumarchaeota archaeon]|nr:hypothetical protein [Nitrososphaerota archaeon]